MYKYLCLHIIYINY